jgi:diguanylate cyclase (GGDEF)-like protein
VDRTPHLHETRLTGRVVTWATIGGLGVVLALVAAIALGGAVAGERAVREVRQSGDLAGAYLRALDGLSREDMLEDTIEGDYDEGPSPEGRADFAAARRQLDGALRELLERGEPRDRELARMALTLHDEYADAMEAIFDAAAAGERARAEELDEERADPAQDELQALVNNVGPRHALEQLGAIDDLERTEVTLLKRTAAVVLVGGALYVLLLVVFLALRSRLERAQRAELDVTREQARTDELTGLGNRRHVMLELDERLRATGQGAAPFGVLLVDVDRFKEINDTLGHHVGDELLRQLARRLRRALGEDAVLARLGGDEFVALVSAPGGTPDAVAAAHGFLALLAHVRASVGLALAPDHGDDRSVLLRHADVAMYRAKAGGGGVGVYADEADEHGLERIVLAGELRAALDGEGLVVHYQPKADLATGAVTSVEALVRWQHPTRGLLAPGVFLPLADQHGMLARVTSRVLEIAAAQAVAWAGAGRPLRVAVNLAPANLLDARFPDEVAALLRRTGLDPGLLQLEITENTIMVDPVRVLDVVARLAELGLSFALDDFGTGYSSLAYLKRLPVRELKIDRSFVMDMDRSRDDAVIVRSTVDLARNLGLTVVAEGVETHETWERLAAFGCHAAQGFFLSRPLPADELEGWIAGHAAAGHRPGA